MSITHMISNNLETFPDGANCPLQWNQRDAEGSRPRNPIVLHTTHHGLCLRDGERNSYHDSDFYMTVWVPETGKPMNIEYASTRGWSYPCYDSHVDATPEVKAAYAAYLARSEKVSRVQSKLRDRRLRAELAKKADLTIAQVRRLEKVYGNLRAPHYGDTGAVIPIIRRILQLLASARTARLKSEFKRSIATRIRTWVEDPAPAYAEPLSYKQRQCI